MVEKHLEKPKLKRQLGLIEVMLVGLGIIFGAVIYALLGEATAIAGSSVWLSFLIAALVAGFTGLSYAYLAGVFPRAGAEYEGIECGNSQTCFVAIPSVVPAGSL